MTRLRSAIDFSLAVLVAASALYSLPFLVSAAHAGVDPVPVATTSVDAVLAIAQTYGALWGGVTLAYALVRWLLARNESTHWLAQGRTLATITMLVGTAGSALQAHFAGTPWSGVIATAVLGVVHLADSNVTPAPAPAVKTGQAGFARLGLLALLAAVGLATLGLGGGCAGSTQTTRQATLSTATVVTTTMLKTVEAYDKTVGDQIVATSTEPAKAQADLAALRKRVHDCIKVITAAIDAIAVAKTANDDPSLTGVQKALNEIITDVTDLTGGK